MDTQLDKGEKRPPEQPRKNYALHMILSVLVAVVGIATLGAGLYRSVDLFDVSAGILLLLGGAIAVALKLPRKVLRSLAHATVAFLGVHGLLSLVFFMPVGLSGGSTPVIGVIFVIFTFIWLFFAFVSFVVLGYALVRQRTKAFIVPAVVSMALNVFIFFCYLVLFASGHD